MKKTLPVLALSTMMATAPAFAQSSTQANYNTAVVNSQVATPQAINTAQADLNFVFDNTENLQTMAMTNEQMAETQGAFSLASINTSLVARGALTGANIANWEYLGGVVAGGDYSPYAHAFHIGGGAVAGGVGVQQAGKLLSPMQSYLGKRIGAAYTATEQRLSEIDKISK